MPFFRLLRCVARRFLPCCEFASVPSWSQPSSGHCTVLTLVRPLERMSHAHSTLVLRRGIDCHHPDCHSWLDGNSPVVQSSEFSSWTSATTLVVAPPISPEYANSRQTSQQRFRGVHARSPPAYSCSKSPLARTRHHQIEVGLAG